MANELRHSSTATAAGLGMAKPDWEDVDIHQFNSQATGDIMYASSATQLSRLAAGAQNTVLVMGASIPAWSATLAGLTLTSPTINGTIATTGLTLPAVTLGGNMTITGRIFDAGAGNAQINTTGGGAGLLVQSTNDGATGAFLDLKQVTTSVAVNDIPVAIRLYSRDGAGANFQYGSMYVKLDNVTDGTEESHLTWETSVSGAGNTAMTLSGAGVLAVDLAGSGAAAQVDLFDEYDDALVLRQGIQQNNRELLADIGVLDRKDTGSGYMMKIQPMVRLLAGGIYQSRAMIDELIERLELAEGKLKLLGVG